VGECATAVANRVGLLESSDATPKRQVMSGQNAVPTVDSTTTDRVMRACAIRQDPSRGQTMSLRFFSGRIFTTFRAGLALNIASSPVKGLIPLRALVAGFRTTTSFIRPGTV